MRILVAAIASVVLAGFGLEARADSHDHHSDWGHHDSHGGYGCHGYGSGYYGHGYPYYGGYGGGIYIQTPPIIVGGSRYYSRPVYEGREVYRSSLEVDVQLALRKRGYYNGQIDGDIGPGSRAAIRAFQRDHGLRQTGTINDSLLDRLGL